MGQFWQQSETGEQFISLLESSGYTIAQGECCKYALVDRDGEVSNLVRQLPTLVKAKDVDAVLNEYYHRFLTVKQVRAEQRERQAELTAHQEQKLKRQLNRIKKRVWERMR